MAGEVAAEPGRDRIRSIKMAAGYGRRVYDDNLPPDSFRARVVLPLRQRLGGVVLRLSPKTTTSAVATRLQRAGLTRRFTPMGFLATKAVASVAGLIGGALLGTAGPGGAAGGVFAVRGGPGGRIPPET